MALSGLRSRAYCKADEDDPKDAVLYFFPIQTSESQRYSLCCQIVGVAKFLKATFSSPSVIALDQEKFVLYWSGKYLFALGGSSDVHENVLKQELLFLCGIFCFYHGSINSLLKTCKNDRKEFLDKMELAWSRYISLSQCFNNLLNVPVHTLPLPYVKKYSECVSKANELLRMCQLSASVVAGAVYCNNRVLSSQLTPELTSYLTLLSNENASTPVANVFIPVKNLPPNLELKTIYLSQRTVQSILKHNHVHMGSSVRVKVEKKPQLSQSSGYCETITSGSEADVDSGHCTEIVFQSSKSKKVRASKLKSSPCFELDFKSQLLCCYMHAEIFEKDILKCRNKIFRKYINSEFVTELLNKIEKKKSVYLNQDAVRTVAYQKTKRGTHAQNEISSCNLICQTHANTFSFNFVDGSSNAHQNLSSTSDLEYSCYFCINDRFPGKPMLLQSKNWNSEMHIPEYFSSIPKKTDGQGFLLTGDKLKKEKATKCKIQVLKCRTKIDTCNQCTKKLNVISHPSKKHCSEQVFADLTHHHSNNQRHHLSMHSYISKDYYGNMESNDLEKWLLYVQRFENNMVVLLLNRNYDENIFSYLWNCGFTFLKELEYQEEKKSSENKIESVNYILLHDNVQKVLKERPHYQAFAFPEKHAKNSIQAIQEDFLSNSKLQMFSLLSANQNVFAYQTKYHSAFYLQQDLNSKKSDSLSNLSKKAVHRLEKYINLSS